MQPLTIPAHLPRLADRFDVSDADLQEQAEKAASSMRTLADLWERNGKAPNVILKTLRRIAKRHCIYPPAQPGLQAQINRMCDAAFWRRALRTRFKAVELTAIQRGAVHRHASPYISDKGLRRHERQVARVADQMAALVAINQTTGEMRDMPELIEASLANPKHRRTAMMVRIKGIEASATARGHVGLFLTITCPSRMHPRSSKTGAANPTYDGTWPTKAHAHLRRVWSRAMREAAHKGMAPYGVRVVEPHHDACPHWHVLAFIEDSQADAFASLVRRFALLDSPNEVGAQERRFTVERIDPAKGSAVGYVAKYVSKSIDGEGVEADTESDSDGRSAARRQVAWARTWSIRQFQFFGVPPITPTRELFRVDGNTLPGQVLPELHAACKANDYAKWLHLAETHGLRFGVDYSERPSTRFRGEQTKAVQGLRIVGGDLPGELRITTRCDTWRVEPRAKASASHAEHEGERPSFSLLGLESITPQSLISNDFFPGALPEGVEVWGDDGRGEEGVPHRAPLPGAGRGPESSRPAG